MQRLHLSPWPFILLIIFIFSSASAGKPKIFHEKNPGSVQFSPIKPSENERLKAIYRLKKEKITNAVQYYFKDALAQNEMIGAAVSVVQGDSLLISQGFGKRKIMGLDSINAKTVFRLGSLSKGFTGVLTGMLVDEGKLQWDSKVEDYVNGFRLGSDQNTSRITLAGILSHTSGAPRHTYSDLIEQGYRLTDIAKRFENIKPESEPGELYNYQNAVFALSGIMIKKVTGKTINASLQERIFEPLGMTTASTDYKSLIEGGNFALPHYGKESGWLPRKINEKYYNAVAAGGVNASAQDMAKWMRFLLGHDQQVASNAVLQQVFKPEIEIEGKEQYYQQWPGHIFSHYAHGWRLHEFKDEQTGEVEIVVHHGGSVSSYRNEIAIYPSADLGICVLFNSSTSLAKTVIPDLYQRINAILNEKINLPIDELLTSI